MYKNGTEDSYDVTHFGQKLDFCNIRTIWDDLYKSSDFEKRQKEVENSIRENRWRKRGIAMVPQKHGIGFTEPRGSLKLLQRRCNGQYGRWIGFHLPRRR